MQDVHRSELESVCKSMVSAFQGVVVWKQDSRFGTVLAEFPVVDKEKVGAILQPYLGAVWDSANISKAPDSVQTVAKLFGGLRADQVLMSSDPDKGVCLYGAWWPWGDGQTISLRITPYDTRLSALDMAELEGQVKGWFGI